jgi:hypothetical protein
MMNKPVFILGFDGLSPDFWDDCPETLRMSKYHGVLESVEPPISPSAWASFLTGVDPDHHGIKRWREAGEVVADFGHSLVSGLWQEWPKTTFALFNMPLLRPQPEAFNVTHFAGGLLWGANDPGCFKPSLWGKQLLALGYRVHVNGCEDIGDKHGREYPDYVMDCAATRRLLPLPPADVTVLVYVFPDVISHAQWRIRDRIREMHAWVVCEWAYWLKQRNVERTHDWVIVSDHGFQDVDSEDHLAILESIGENRVPWMQGGHHKDGVFMSNWLDLRGASIKDVLVRVLEEKGEK